MRLGTGLAITLIDMLAKAPEGRRRRWFGDAAGSSALWLLLSTGLMASLSAGCDVRKVSDEAPPATLNQCSSDAECGVGGLCKDGACSAEAGRFTTVLFGVTPPADVGSIAGVRFLKRIDELDAAGGPLELELPVVSRVKLIPKREAYIPECEGENAAATDEEVVLNVTFTPTERVLGLSTPSYSASVAVPPESGSESDLSLPTGQYDIYIEPQVADETCQVPPQLISQFEIGAGDVEISFNRPAPSQLQLHVCWPEEEGELTGWMADIIDQDTARLLSTRAELSELCEGGDCPCGEGKLDYLADLSFSPVVNSDETSPGEELVRLSPPDDLVAPTILMARSPLEVKPGVAVLDQFDKLPETVEFHATVFVKGSAETAQATVTLSATEIEGIEPGTFASFTRSVETDENGGLVVDLLAGSYRVHALPEAKSELAAAQTTWQVSSEAGGQTCDGKVCQKGQVIEVPQRVTVEGTVTLPNNRGPVVGATVMAVATPASSVCSSGQAAVVQTQPCSAISQAYGAVRTVPRAGVATTSVQGGFRLSADPGTFDVSVRPPQAARFAWLVRPNVQVSETMDPLSMVLPLPVRYRGTVTTPELAEGTVGGALIRAYVYMDGDLGYTSEPGEAASVLQIGEVLASEDGEFELLLPSRLN